MSPDVMLFLTALRDQLRPRKLVVAAALVALPAGMAVLWRTLDKSYRPEITYTTLAAMLVFGFTLVILSLIFGTGTVSQDLEERTIVYLLTRPVPRWRVLAARFAASLVAIVVTCWVSLLALAMVAYGPLKMGGSRVGSDLLLIPVGALAYGGLFLFLATFTRRSLIFGLLYAFGWESWVPNLPGAMQRLSLMSYLRALGPRPDAAGSDAELQRVLSAVSPATISSGLAWMVLACVIFATLAAALVIFSEREYAPREDAE
jgi:ABC-2 type transport system permease protein